MKKFHHQVHSNWIVALFVGEATGIIAALSFLFLNTFIHSGDYLRLIEFNSVWPITSLALSLGGLSGLIYFQIAKRDPRWAVKS